MRTSHHLQMHFSVRQGDVILQWPVDIEADDIEDAWEAISLQFASMRRAAGERERLPTRCYLCGESPWTSNHTCKPADCHEESAT